MAAVVPAEGAFGVNGLALFKQLSVVAQYVVSIVPLNEIRRSLSLQTHPEVLVELLTCKANYGV